MNIFIFVQVKCNAHPVMQLVYNVPNLIEDRKYEFRIFAVNKAGRGKPSSASNSVTVKDPYGKGNSFLLIIYKLLSIVLCHRLLKITWALFATDQRSHVPSINIKYVFLFSFSCDCLILLMT